MMGNDLLALFRLHLEIATYLRYVAKLDKQLFLVVIFRFDSDLLFH